LEAIVAKRVDDPAGRGDILAEVLNSVALIVGGGHSECELETAQAHLRYLIREFMRHNTERFHQGLSGQLIKGHPGSANDNRSNGSIVRRSPLGGLLDYYQREAA